MDARQRHVVRAGLAWLALAWLTAAIANLLFPALGLPMIASRWLIFGLLGGFFVVLVLAWRTAGTASAESEHREHRARRLDQATVVLVLAALSLSLLHQFLRPYAERRETPAVAVAPTKSAPPAIPIDPHSIAVLPFANLSPDPDDAYFADGLAEELRNVIARIDGLKVTSRSSSFQFRDGSTGAGEIAKRLGVAYLLEGSVRRQDEDVRITVQLVDAASERQLWSNTYERDLGDIFGVQQEISQAVADALADSLGVREVQVSPSTQDLQAYEQYLRGRQLFMQRGATLPAARGLLEQAVERDPDFADAWAALAGTWYVWRAYAPDPAGVDTFLEAEKASARALKLDPEHAAALAVAARIAADRGDRLREAELIGRSLALAPNDANTWLWKGLGQYEAGLVGAAHASFLQARQLDPLSGLHIGWVGITTPDRNTRTALLQEAHALGWRGPASRALLLDTLRAGDDATAAYEAWLHDDDSLPVRQRAFARSLAPALVDAARLPAAQQRLRQAIAADPGLEWALLLQLFGLTDEAIDAALRTDAGSAQVLRLNLWQDEFASFRAHPRFREWAQREGLLDYWRRYGAPDGCRLGEAPEPVLGCD